MGRVTAEAIVENLSDLIQLKKGELSADQVRRVTISDALVDTGATSFAMPVDLLNQLGLTKRYERRARSVSGTSVVNVYESVRLTIMGRDMPIDPIELPEGSPVLIGQIPLEMFDLVIDMQQQKLIGNPAHNGEQLLELYGFEHDNAN
jgi:predicted aspartyl protease